MLSASVLILHDSDPVHGFWMPKAAHSSVRSWVKFLTRLIVQTCPYMTCICF